MSYKFTSKTWAQIEAAINRVFTAITASRALVSDESGNVTASAVTATELSYLEGAESNLQEQINNIETGSGITSITTDTDTEIDGILKGAEGKVAAAVSLTDFMPGYDLADFETWGADTDYTAGISKVYKVNTDVDYYNYHYYICKTTHNSGSEFSDDNWVKVTSFALPVPGVGLVYPYDILTVASWETGTEYNAGDTKEYTDDDGNDYYIQAKETHTSTGENPFENDTAKWNVLVIIPGGGLENVVEDLTPQLGGNLDLNENAIQQKGAPASDHTVSGNIISLTAGIALAFGDVCYMGSDGKMEKGDADAVANAFCFAMAIATISEDAAGLFALPGAVVRDDSWNWATLGQPVYLDTATAGGLTQTPPSGTDDVIQVIGIATHADRILFLPQLIQVEHT